MKPIITGKLADLNLRESKFMEFFLTGYGNEGFIRIVLNEQSKTELEKTLGELSKQRIKKLKGSKVTIMFEKDV